jgi:CheY-like chemotaxis protein
MSKTILLVDDEEDVRGLVELMLLKEDFQLLAARAGNEALRIVQEEPVDLILLDLMMPGMSGQDLLKILKKMPSTRDIPVVVLTALENKETMKECLELGAAGYVQKPFAKKILVRTLKNVLDMPDEPVQRSESTGRTRKASGS